MSSAPAHLKPIWDHVGELRTCLVKSLLAVVLGCGVVYHYIDTIMFWIIKPVGQVIFTSPADAFVARLTLSILGGFILGLPVILHQLWSFVALALKDNERRYILMFGPLSLLFFIAGILFAYFIALPFSVRFLLGFANEWMAPMITIRNYISFFVTLVVAFGVIFELPIILVFLTAIGVATPAFLSQKRRHAIVLILFVSAVITPPDLVTLLIMTCPLLVLYELGVIASKITYRQKYSLDS